MTDGYQSYAADQIDIPVAVKPLIDGGVLRYAIGIGEEISPVELRAIAGDNVVLAEDFDQLVNKIETQVRLIGQRGCKGELFDIMCVRNELYLTLYLSGNCIFVINTSTIKIAFDLFLRK